MEQKEKDSKRFISPGGAGIAAICFFLPWFRACGQEISGLKLATSGDYLLWLTLVSAIAIIGGFIAFDRQIGLKKLKPLALVSAILGLLIMLFKLIQLKQEGGDMVGILPGYVGSVLGFIVSIVGLQFWKGTHTIDRSHSQAHKEDERLMEQKDLLKQQNDLLKQKQALTEENTRLKEEWKLTKEEDS